MRIPRPASSAILLLTARLSGAAFGFLTQIVLARLVSPRDLGLYFAATSFAALAGLGVTQGYPGIMQRFVTRYRERHQRAVLSAFARQVQLESIVVFLAVSLALTFAASALTKYGSDEPAILFGTIAAIGAAAALSTYGAFSAIERRFELAQFPENLFRPLLFLSLIALIHAFGATLSAGVIIALFAGLSIVLAVFQYLRILPQLPSWPHRANIRPQLRRRWRNEALLFALAILFATAFADLALILASPFLGPEGLAPFGVAIKTSLLIGFAVQVAHQVVLPDLAEAHHKKDLPGIIRPLGVATVLPTVITGAALLASTFGGSAFLSMFGPHYVSAADSLVILVAAQFLRAMAGPGQSLLMLKGAQTLNAGICVACTIALAAMNAALVPAWGLAGAALSVLAVLSLWFGSTGYFLAARYGLRVDIVFFLADRRSRVAASS